MTKPGAYAARARFFRSAVAGASPPDLSELPRGTDMQPQNDETRRVRGARQILDQQSPAHPPGVRLELGPVLRKVRRFEHDHDAAAAPHPLAKRADRRQRGHPHRCRSIRRRVRRQLGDRHSVGARRSARACLTGSSCSAASSSWCCSCARRAASSRSSPTNIDRCADECGRRELFGEVLGGLKYSPAARMSVRLAITAMPSATTSGEFVRLAGGRMAAMAR